ncbi:hypothetical protein J6590_016050 [Homalodisca vitripennis]|nr:hypothetical protein J6590_016050 [Homalodisca vitripennis]
MKDTLPPFVESPHRWALWVRKKRLVECHNSSRSDTTICMECRHIEKEVSGVGCHNSWGSDIAMSIECRDIRHYNMYGMTAYSGLFGLGKRGYWSVIIPEEAILQSVWNVGI